MAKFKVGDKVKIAKGSLHIGEIGTIIAEKGSGYVVDIAGKWAMDANDNILVAANFRALNAKFKVGDRVNDSGTWGKIVAVLKKSASGETLYAFSPESGPAKGHAYEILEGKLSLNSRACNSSNPIVCKAMNAVARNSDSQVFAAQAASYFKDAYGGIQGCITCLERLRDYGKPNGFTDKDAESGKKWADKVYDKVVRLSQMMKQGQINSI